MKQERRGAERRERAGEEKKRRGAERGRRGRERKGEEKAAGADMCWCEKYGRWCGPYLLFFACCSVSIGCYVSVGFMFCFLPVAFICWFVFIVFIRCLYLLFVSEERDKEEKEGRRRRTLQILTTPT